MNVMRLQTRRGPKRDLSRYFEPEVGFFSRRRLAVTNKQKTRFVRLTLVANIPSNGLNRNLQSWKARDLITQKALLIRRLGKSEVYPVATGNVENTPKCEVYPERLSVITIV
jgi:hypothetical protein